MENRYTNPDFKGSGRITPAMPVVKAVVVLFYVVGFTGLLIPYSHSFFLTLFPFFLILNAFILGFTHAGTKSPKALVIFLLILLLGFLVEAIGVKTGMIFGNYHYGDSLGLKIADTPVVIGLNWLMLVYLTSGILERSRLSMVLQIVLASGMMLIYDLVLEQVAPKTGMWYWENGHAPVQNYVAWFALSVIFHSILKLAGTRTSNPLTTVIFICQFLFFLFLLIFLP